MRKMITVMLFVSFYLTAYNQTINGTIFDKNTNEKISFATVYFDGTFVGRSADINGEFTINIGDNANKPLIVSSIGYYSASLEDLSKDKPLIIYLTPKVYNINEATISDISLVKKRKKILKLFKEIFLGTTENALNCEITNEQDISFNYGSDHDTLKAFASKPIHINNKALGYVLTCHLDKFEYCRKSRTFLFVGNYFFNKDLAFETADNKSYLVRRENAYLGSRMHFFRALWANDLFSAGFRVKNLADKEINCRDIVIHEANNLLDTTMSMKKYLQHPDGLKILYYSNSSKIVFSKANVYFDETGYCDLGINWEGEMIIRRTGDMLPYEYKIK
jgi:hypothetical protein